MKKFSYLLMMVCIVVAASLTSCSKDDEKNASVIGTWKVGKLMANGKDVTSTVAPFAGDMMKMTATFSEDGKLTMATPATEDAKAQSVYVQYTLEGNEIALVMPTDELTANTDMIQMYNLLKMQGFKISLDGNMIHSGMSGFNLKAMIDMATAKMDAATKAMMMQVVKGIFGDDLTKVDIDVQWVK